MSDSLREPDREKEELGHPINEPIQAYSQREAVVKCLELARQYERELVDVRSEGRSWFRCYFQ